VGSVGGVLTQPDAVRAPLLRQRRAGGDPSWLVLPALLVLIPVFVVPTAFVLVRSVSEEPAGLTHYSKAFESELVRTVLVRSAMIAAAVTLISLVVALPYAVAAVRSGPRLRAVLLGAVATSLFISVIVRSYAWLAILDRQGPVTDLTHALGITGPDFSLVHNLAGVLIGMTQYGVPLMVMAIYDVMRRLDGRLEKAAATLGAGPVTRWRKVNLPLIMPGVAAGMIIVFISTLGYYIIPAILGSPRTAMVGQLIATQVGTTLNWGLGAALASILLVGTMVSFALFRRASRWAEGR
jgi:ABC-type spermidine/putrescine transport system permease subunit I